MTETGRTIPAISPYHNTASSELADEHGRLAAEIAALEARRKAIAAELIRRGDASVAGELFTATVVAEAMVATVDRKAIEAEMGEAWIARFLKWSRRCAAVRTTPREAAADLTTAA
jgi:hypothetical protein